MTTTEALEAEYDGLDIPVLSADAIILAITENMTREDAFAAFDAAADFENHNKSAIQNLIALVLDNALESSLQIAHIRRGMEIQFQISDLEDLDN